MAARKAKPQQESTPGQRSGDQTPQAAALASGIIEELRAFTTAMDRYIDVHGAAHGLHRTDLHALAHIMEASRSGDEVSPGDLASALNLSSPATSALLSRLEAVGHVRRSHSVADRRRVSVAMTQEALSVGGQVFGPLGAAIRDLVADLSMPDRQTVLQFLQDVVAVTDGLARCVPTVPADHPVPRNHDQAADRTSLHRQS